MAISEETKKIKKTVEQIKKLYITLPDTSKLEIYDFIIFGERR